MCDTDNAGKLNYDQLITLFGLMSLAQNGQKPDVAGIGPDTPPPKIEGISLDDPAGGGGGSFDDNEAITAMATKLFGMFKQGPDGSLQAGYVCAVLYVCCNSTVCLRVNGTSRPPPFLVLSASSHVSPTIKEPSR